MMQRNTRAQGAVASAAPDRAETDTRLVDTRHSVPEILRASIGAAPARGLLVVSREKAAGPGYVTGPGDPGYRLRTSDVFDRMEAAARRAKVDFFLTPSQVSAARRYRDMVERYNAGLSARSTLSSMLPGGAGGGGEMSAMDCHLTTARRYDRAVLAIGSRVAKEVRRVRPSRRGPAGAAGAQAISDRALVDAVAVYDMTLDQVLKWHGWSCFVDHRRALQGALAAALDRLADAI